MFELSLSGVADKRIVASFTGYRTNTIAWTGNNEIIIVLEPSANTLDQVTITNQTGAFISASAITKTEVINRVELSKAACCDFAGCFGTQASVQAHPTNAVKGVTKMKIDPEANTITVTYRTDKTNPDEIRKAISASGYDADNVKADPMAYQKLDGCCKVK